MKRDPCYAKRSRASTARINITGGHLDAPAHVVKERVQRQLPPGRPPHLGIVEELAEVPHRPHQIGRRVLGRSLAGPQQHPLKFLADVFDLLPVGGLLALLDPRPLPHPIQAPNKR